MLVLSRRRDETIMINDDVEITIVEIRGEVVRLGINAPKTVSVHRKEIYEAIKAENIAAASHQEIPDAVALGGLAKLLAGQKTKAMNIGTTPVEMVETEDESDLKQPIVLPAKRKANSGLGRLTAGHSVNTKKSDLPTIDSDSTAQKETNAANTLSALFKKK